MPKRTSKYPVSYAKLTFGFLVVALLGLVAIFSTNLTGNFVLYGNKRITIECDSVFVGTEYAGLTGRQSCTRLNYDTCVTLIDRVTDSQYSSNNVSCRGGVQYTDTRDQPLSCGNVIRSWQQCSTSSNKDHKISHDINGVFCCKVK